MSLLSFLTLAQTQPLADSSNDTASSPLESLQQGWEFFSVTPLGPFTAGQLVLSFAVILATLLLRNFLTKIVFHNLKRLALKTKTEYDDRILQGAEKPLSVFILGFGLFLAIGILPLEEEWRQILTLCFRGFSTLVVFWGLLRMIDIATDAMAVLSAQRGTSLQGFVPLIRKTVRIFIVIVGVVMVLDNLGYSVGGILATLGLGGAALAFAAKDTIANLYGSVALALDRPFKVGDWIQVGNVVDGDVEGIGLRSTRVRTWPKTVLSIPNSVLANEMINNWSRMPKRRVKQVVGVTYEATPEQMDGLVEDIRNILRSDEGVNQDFILVNFTDFGESSLEILVYYFTSTIKWLEHMDVRQRINLKIMDAVRAKGLSIAFPTRTLYFEGDVARKLAGGWGQRGSHPGPTGFDLGDDDPSGRGGSAQGKSGLPGDFGPIAPL